MSFRDLLTQAGSFDLGTVTGRTSTGQEVVTWSLLVEDAPVLVRPLGLARELALVLQPGIQEAYSHVVYSEILPDVVAVLGSRLRIRVGSITYVVVEIYDPANRGHHWEIKVRKVTP